MASDRGEERLNGMSIGIVRQSTHVDLQCCVFDRKFRKIKGKSLKFCLFSMFFIEIDNFSLEIFKF